MKEALDVVIKDLEARRKKASYMYDVYLARGETNSEMINYGLFVAYDKAIDKLKGVLSQHEQVPEQKNDSH